MAHLRLCIFALALVSYSLAQSTPSLTPLPLESDAVAVEEAVGNLTTSKPQLAPSSSAVAPAVIKPSAAVLPLPVVSSVPSAAELIKPTATVPATPSSSVAPPTTAAPTTAPPTTTSPTTAPPTTTPPTTTPPTTTEPTTTTTTITTAEPNTTTTSTTTTTTTTAPATTTTTTTTTTPPSTSAPTTSAPTTTAATTTPAVTTVAPTLPPTPSIVTYVVKSKDSNQTESAVLKAKLGVRIQIGKVAFDLTNSTKSSGNDRTLVLTTATHVLTLQFSDGRQITGSGMWFLTKISLNVTESEKVKSAALQKDDGIKSVDAHKGNSFACDAGMMFNLTGDFNATIKAFDLRVQPFMSPNANGFGMMERCDDDKIHNNVVPIAVGAALAVLVIIVLVLYLIGRRKHQRGYETV